MNIFNRQKKIKSTESGDLFDPITGEKVAELRDGKVYVNNKKSNAPIVNDEDDT